MFQVHTTCEYQEMKAKTPVSFHLILNPRIGLAVPVVSEELVKVFLIVVLIMHLHAALKVSMIAALRILCPFGVRCTCPQELMLHVCKMHMNGRGSVGVFPKTNVR